MCKDVVKSFESYGVAEHSAQIASIGAVGSEARQFEQPNIKLTTAWNCGEPSKHVIRLEIV